MSTLERFLGNLHASYTATPDPTSIPFPEHIQARQHQPLPTHPSTTRRCNADARHILAIATSATETVNDRNVPHPPAIIRMTPPT